MFNEPSAAPGDTASDNCAGGTNSHAATRSGLAAGHLPATLRAGPGIGSPASARLTGLVRFKKPTPPLVFPVVPMNPISAALRRPITVMVLIAGTAFAGALAYSRMKVDIFPALNLPVIYVCQTYGGMDPQQMEGLIAYYSATSLHQWHPPRRVRTHRACPDELCPPRH